jgi:hypothetical protein
MNMNTLNTPLIQKTIATEQTVYACNKFNMTSNIILFNHSFGGLSPPNN